MLSIYNYDDPITFISDYIEQERVLDPSFSLKQWSLGLGFKSVAPVLDILKKRTAIKDSHFQKFIHGLRIDKSELMYLQALVSRERAQTNEKKNMYQLILKELAPENVGEDHSCLRTQLDLFSHWIYMAILTMAKIDHFIITPDSVEKALKFSIERDKIESALADLIKFKLLSYDDSGKLVRHHTIHTTATDIKHDNVNAYYEGVCELAKMSINVALEEREFQCFSMAMPKDKIPLAKEIIRKCRKQLGSLSDEKTNEIAYQMNLMMFPISHDLRLEDQLKSKN